MEEIAFVLWSRAWRISSCLALSTLSTTSVWLLSMPDIPVNTCTKRRCLQFGPKSRNLLCLFNSSAVVYCLVTEEKLYDWTRYRKKWQNTNHMCPHRSFSNQLQDLLNRYWIGTFFFLSILQCIDESILYPALVSCLTSSSQLLFPTARRKRAVREFCSSSHSSGVQVVL